MASPTTPAAAPPIASTPAGAPTRAKTVTGYSIPGQGSSTLISVVTEFATKQPSWAS